MTNNPLWQAGSVSSVLGGVNRNGTLDVSGSLLPVVQSVSGNMYLQVVQNGTASLVLLSNAAPAIGVPTTTIPVFGTVDLANIPNGARVAFTASGVITNTGTTIADGYGCEVSIRPANAGTVTFGPGITPDGTLTQGTALIRAQALGGTLTVYADVMQVSNGTAIESLTVSNLGTYGTSQAFTVSGTFNGFNGASTSFPALKDSIDAGTYSAASNTNTVTGTGSGTYSFSTSIASPGTHTVSVVDTGGLAAPITTSVVITSSKALSLTGPTTVQYVPSGGTVDSAVPFSVGLASYGSAPTLDVSLNSGTSWAGGTIVAGSSLAATGTLSLAAGVYGLQVRDHGTTSILSNIVPFSVEGAGITGAPSTGTVGVPLNTGTVTLTGISAVNCGLYQGTTLASTGTVSLASTGSVLLVPSLSGGSTLKVTDASGNLLAQSGTVTVSVAAPGTPSVGLAGATQNSVVATIAIGTGGLPATYNLWYNTTGSGTPPTGWTQATGGSITFTGNPQVVAVTGLSPSTAYYFEVNAVNAGGTSSFSSALPIATTANASTVGTPTALTSSAQTTTSVTWTWGAPATGGAVASYVVETSTDGTTWSGPIAVSIPTTGAAPSYTQTGLTASTSPALRYLRVAAVNASGTGTYTSGVSQAPLAISKEGTAITSAGQQIVDASGNIWTLANQSLTGVGPQVATNGTVDGNTYVVSRLAYFGGAIWQENTSPLWWAETLPNSSWSPTSGLATEDFITQLMATLIARGLTP